MGNDRRTVAVESTLERDFALLQRFDRDVIGLEEQPVRISYRDHVGAKRSYIPDFLVTYRQGAPKLVEVKFSTDPALVGGELEPRFAAARTYSAARGWSFYLATEADIRTPRLSNATFLLPFRPRPADPALRASILQAIQGKPRTVEWLAAIVSMDTGCDRAQVLPSLWGMVARFELAADLDRPLTMRSHLKLPNGGLS
jgi:hypothetical protein